MNIEMITEILPAVMRFLIFLSSLEIIIYLSASKYLKYASDQGKLTESSSKALFLHFTISIIGIYISKPLLEPDSVEMLSSLL